MFALYPRFSLVEGATNASPGYEAKSLKMGYQIYFIQKGIHFNKDTKHKCQTLDENQPKTYILDFISKFDYTNFWSRKWKSRHKNHFRATRNLIHPGVLLVFLIEGSEPSQDVKFWDDSILVFFTKACSHDLIAAWVSSFSNNLKVVNSKIDLLKNLTDKIDRFDRTHQTHAYNTVAMQYSCFIWTRGHTPKTSPAILNEIFPS